MIFIVLGCLGFVLLYIFDINDINKVINLHKYFNLCFPLGFLLLAVSAVLLLLVSPVSFQVSIPRQLINALPAVISLALLTYSLFFALLFTKTHLDLSKRSAQVNTEIYAFCRHSGMMFGLSFSSLSLLGLRRNYGAVDRPYLDGYGYYPRLRTRSLAFP